MIDNKKTSRRFVGDNPDETERASMDFYATDPVMVEMLLDKHPLPKEAVIWECAAGMGHIADVLTKRGHKVLKTDLVKRRDDIIEYDFLAQLHYGGVDFSDYRCDIIITNPPFAKATEFILQAMIHAPIVIMLLRNNFLEGIARYNALFKHGHLKHIYAHINRGFCARNGDFTAPRNGLMFYNWLVFDKNYKGLPIFDWLYREF